MSDSILFSRISEDPLGGSAISTTPSDPYAWWERDTNHTVGPACLVRARYQPHHRSRMLGESAISTTPSDPHAWLERDTNHTVGSACLVRARYQPHSRSRMLGESAIPTTPSVPHAWWERDNNRLRICTYFYSKTNVNYPTTVGLPRICIVICC